MKYHLLVFIVVGEITSCADNVLLQDTDFFRTAADTLQVAYLRHQNHMLRQQCADLTQQYDDMHELLHMSQRNYQRLRNIFVEIKQRASDLQYRLNEQSGIRLRKQLSCVEQQKAQQQAEIELLTQKIGRLNEQFTQKEQRYLEQLSSIQLELNELIARYSIAQPNAQLQRLELVPQMRSHREASLSIQVAWFRYRANVWKRACELVQCD